MIPTMQTTSREDRARADVFYRALAARDVRFDGRFFTAVRTTGIYCRPICPARTPLRRNVEFFSCAAAAETAGYRPCHRCRPDAAPESPEWRGTRSTVSRALRLIVEGALDTGGVTELADRLGVGERQLHRLFVEHLGATPVEVAQTRRAHRARRLLDETDLPIAEIAFAAGFRSVRRFNEVFRRSFGCPPSQLDRPPSATRRSEPRRSEAGVEPPRTTRLRLRPRPPFDWPALCAFLEPRCVSGLESVESGRYRRRLPVGSGWIEVGVHPNHPESLELITDLAPGRDLLRWAERARDAFDLDADTGTITDTLARDPVLQPHVLRTPGLRIPGAWDGFEMAVRAVLGQQVTVRGGLTLAARVLERCGAIEAERLASTDLSGLGIPERRTETLRLLAERVASGELSLEPWSDPEGARTSLGQVPGIGPWTVEYICMRALRDPDAFPASDLGIRKALGQNGRPCTTADAKRRAEAWRPWRAYAAAYLWRSL